MPDASQFTIGFLGDTSFGENYQAANAARGAVNVLEAHGYAYSLANFRDFLAACDLVVANLETPLTLPGPSPLDGNKTYVHWSDVEKAPASLAAHNVRAVSLANNHTMDHGPEGLAETLRSLREHGISYFGAGRDAREANQPFEHSFTLAGHTHRVAVFGAFELRRKYATDYAFYAGEDRPGVGKLKLPEYAEHIARFKQDHPDVFVIVFPHWGLNYLWRSSKQTRAAHALIEAGADLILGHGAHMLGEVERFKGRWIFYSVGNFVFNSDGNYDFPGAAPYSLTVQLTVATTATGTERRLRFYPIFSDNEASGYRPRFVDEGEFEAVRDLLAMHSPNQEGELSELAGGRDEAGLYLEVALT